MFMKKWLCCILNIFLILSFQSLSINVEENEKIAQIFEKNGVSGTFVVYDVKNKKFVGYNGGRAKERFYPASTFKIYNSLIGLHTGVVKNVDEIFYKYNGEKVFLESWAKDSNLRYAIKVSQVPAHRLLARKIGLKRMQLEINKLNFGNKIIGEKVDKFWLQGPLKISAVEQTELLAKLAKNELPYSKKIQKQVQDITTLETTENWVLHGKTGWATENIETPIGWFVGWVEKGDEIYSFAMNMDLPESKDLVKREKIAKEGLKVLGILD